MSDASIPPAPMVVRVIPKKGASHARWYRVLRLRFSSCADAYEVGQCVKIQGDDSAGQLKIEVEIRADELFKAFEAWRAESGKR